MRRVIVTALTLALLVGAAARLPAVEPSEDAWPRRVLLTNDNGIDDVALRELARALAAVTDVYVVAATVDRSGTSNLMAAIRAGRFEVARRDLGEGITAWALDGYPADCVLFALSGPLREAPPDLVISGINGGANLADAWLGSGTIGAARTAAYMGVPAIAVSGVEDDDPAAVRAAVDWTVALVLSDAVRALRAPQYLTVSLPILVPHKIQGVELVRRARGLMSAAATLESSTPQGVESWTLELSSHFDSAPVGTDAAAVDSGRIAVVAMRADEHDALLHDSLAAGRAVLPPWSPPAEAAGDRVCRSGLGLMIDDAEDEHGVEWGVLVEEVLPAGRGAQAGLRAGDVIVELDGVALAQPGREDPDERLVRLGSSLDCGRPYTLTVVRGGERSEVSLLPVADP